MDPSSGVHGNGLVFPSAGLIEAVTEHDANLALIDLEDRKVVAVSSAALRVLGFSISDIALHDVSDFMDEEGRVRGEAALDALQGGVVDFYQAGGNLVSKGGERIPVTEWARAFEVGDRRLALILLGGAEHPAVSPMVEYMGFTPIHMAVGTVDSDWVVTSVSRDIADVLHVSAKDFVGRRLFDIANDVVVRNVFAAAEDRSEGGTVALRSQLKDRSGVTQQLSCIFTSTVRANSHGFVLISEPESPVPATSTRASRLERHLLKIASELQASGILQRIEGLTTSTQLTTLSSLTTRQWEILARLQRGERVPTIASELYVSQSTVRNALSAIFKKFGVHSQAQLLSALADADTSSN